MSAPLILMYHQVDVPRSELEHRFCTPPEEFSRQMKWLKDSGYLAVTLDDILRHVTGTTPLPSKAVHITFDDGFIGVLEHAAPVLSELGMPSTLFALAGRIGATNEWMWHRQFPRRALVSGEHLRMLAMEGMSIGSHTCTHVRLPEVSVEEAQSEIAKSKDELENLLGKEVAHFAYPYGLFTPDIRDFVSMVGYQSACSTRPGFNRANEDRYLLRRIDIAGTDHLWQFQQKLKFGTNLTSRFQPLKYYGRQIASRLGF